MGKVKNKLELLGKFMSSLELSELDVIELLKQSGRVSAVTSIDENKSDIISLIRSNLSDIKLGMIWYEDDTFSFKRVADKKIKAIVELIEDGVVYGDLTASELWEIPEQQLSWNDAKKYIENFLYPCKENEKVVLYFKWQLENVYENYDVVRRTFKEIGKKFREDRFWSFTERSAAHAWFVYFGSGIRYYYDKDGTLSVRPVLALDLN